ncbi:hypothetical protein FOCC_FOCC013585 [Frankliniella occidentalis]|nr:hypothetical protein FOCC_FOCC013585 [Frankliniella occidentalis]
MRRLHPHRDHRHERVQAIQLPPKDVGALVGSKVVMSGWGRTTTHGDISPVLRYVESYVLPNPVCQLPYLLLMQIDESHVCVSGLFKKGTCMGDSGGPLSTIKGKDGNATLVGITSFGMKYSCLVSWPPVFTRVASFLGWIEDGMEQLQGKRRPEGVKHLSRSTTRTP